MECLPQFLEYLYGNKFEVLVDNNPLTYALTTAKLDATGHQCFLLTLVWFELTASIPAKLKNFFIVSGQLVPRNVMQTAHPRLIRTPITFKYG